MDEIKVNNVYQEINATVSNHTLYLIDSLNNRFHLIKEIKSFDCLSISKIKNLDRSQIKEFVFQDESYNIKNNTQQHSISKNDLKMEEEIDISISNKKNYKNRKTSLGRQVEENNQNNNRSLPQVTLSKTTKTPSKDLTEQDPDKSLEELAIIHEANLLFSKTVSKVDPKNIYDLMRKATQEKKLPYDNTNLIISQQIQFSKLWTSRLIQMISKDQALINEIQSPSIKQCAYRFNNSNKDIAQHFAVSESSVTRIIQKWLNIGDVKNYSKSGRPSIFSKGKHEQINEIASKQSFDSINLLKKELDFDISCQRLTQIMHELNIDYCPNSLHNQAINTRSPKKNEDKDKITGYAYAMASLITMTIQEYLIQESLMNKEEKMNVEDFKMLIMNTFQKGVKDAYKINHIIQINKDEKSPIFSSINIAKDNVSKFTKKN
ncbi:hypothetical protein ABPG72_019989 [Tetrahymena utriculariae]